MKTTSALTISHVICLRNMSHLQIENPNIHKQEVWEGIVLHTGITDCSLFSHGAFPIIPPSL